MCKILSCFSNQWFEALKAIKLIQQIAANLNFWLLQEVYFFYALCTQIMRWLTLLSIVGIALDAIEIRRTKQALNHGINTIISVSLSQF